MFDDDPFGASAFQTGGTPKPSSVPQAASPSFPQSSGSTGEKSEYKILNLFWLINPKAYGGTMLPSEAHFCSISFNINFGNLRFELGNMTSESIQGHLVCLNKINRHTNATVYSSAMFQIVTGQPEVHCLEQIVNYTNSDWQNKIKQGIFKTTENSIILSIGDACYEFAGWQKDSLIYSCKFGLNQGFVLSGEHIIRR
jgi:hypothetical protein